MGPWERGISVVEYELGWGERVRNPLNQFWYEHEQHVSHLIEELLQKDGVLNLQVETGAHQLHEIEQLQEVAGLRYQVDDNHNKQPHRHQHRHKAGQRINGSFLRRLVIVEVVHGLLIRAGTDRLFCLLRIEVGDCQVGDDEFYLLVVVLEGEGVRREGEGGEGKVDYAVVEVRESDVHVGYGRQQLGLLAEV